MADDPDIFNLTDIRKPTISKGVEIVTGVLVVGYKKTEAEFMAAYGGKQGPPPAIIFEDEAGNPQTGTPGRDFD
jgi:hypothetical protein